MCTYMALHVTLQLNIMLETSCPRSHVAIVVLCVAYVTRKAKM